MSRINKCIFKNCYKRACFNYPKNVNALYCYPHKHKNMINVLCGKLPNWTKLYNDDFKNIFNFASIMCLDYANNNIYNIWITFVKNLPINIPNKPVLIDIIKELLNIFEQYQDSDCFSHYDNNTEFYKCKKYIMDFCS